MLGSASVLALYVFVTLLARACFVSASAYTGPVLAAGTVPSFVIYIYVLAVPEGSVCASDLYCNAMQSGM